MQVAEVKQHHVSTPQDLIELAGMIARGELVQLEPVNENYILFGVGGNADKQPFTRYQNGKSIRLYNEAGLQAEYKQSRGIPSGTANEIAGLKKQMAGLKRRERTERRKLQSEINGLGEDAESRTEKPKALLDRSYGNGGNTPGILCRLSGN